MSTTQILFIVTKPTSYNKNITYIIDTTNHLIPGWQNRDTVATPSLALLWIQVHLYFSQTVRSEWGEKLGVYLCHSWVQASGPEDIDQSAVIAHLEHKGQHTVTRGYTGYLLPEGTQVNAVTSHPAVHIHQSPGGTQVTCRLEVHRSPVAWRYTGHQSLGGTHVTSRLEVHRSPVAWRHTGHQSPGGTQVTSLLEVHRSPVSRRYTGHQSPGGTQVTSLLEVHRSPVSRRYTGHQSPGGTQVTSLLEVHRSPVSWRYTGQHRVLSPLQASSQHQIQKHKREWTVPYKYNGPSSSSLQPSRTALCYQNGHGHMTMAAAADLPSSA